MSDFSTEPMAGHRVNAEVYEPESAFSEMLNDVAKSYEILRRDRRRVRLTVDDVAWDETKEISVSLETFEQIIEWYEESR